MSKFFRISAKPGKTLLWLWLKNDLSGMKGRVGVDLAGGSMLNKLFFRTERYISVEETKSSLMRV